MADENRRVLLDLYRDAVEDGLESELAKWVFREAKAMGRRELADRRFKRLDSEDFSVRCKAWGADVETARVLVMQHAPDDVKWHKAEQELADAVEEVAVCSRMIALLSRSPPTTNSAPASRSAPSANSSGRPATTQRPGATSGAPRSSASGTSSSNSSTRR